MHIGDTVVFAELGHLTMFAWPCFFPQSTLTSWTRLPHMGAIWASWLFDLRGFVVLKAQTCWLPSSWFNIMNALLRLLESFAMSSRHTYES